MKLSYINIDRIKGRSASFHITEPNVMLVGEIGAGKSAVIEGVLMALNLPTKYGQTNLGRLSPTGSWSCTLGFEGGPVRSLTRGLARNKAVYSANGVPCSAAEYAEKVAQILTIEAHHADLDQFIGLSGQKRAELFSRVLESQEADVETALGGGPGGMAAWATQRGFGDSLETIKPVIDMARRIAGEPAALVNGVKEILLQCQREERAAKAALEESIESAARLHHGQDPAAVRARVKEVDERVGALRERLAAHERDVERFQSTETLVKRAEATAQKAVEALEQARIAASAGEKLAQDVAAAESKLQKAEQHVANIREIANRCEAAAASALASTQAMETFVDLHRQLATVQWEFDEPWLREHLMTFVDALGMVGEPGDDWKSLTTAFIREAVAEALDVDTKLAEAREKHQSAVTRAREAQDALRQAEQDTAKVAADLAANRQALAKASARGEEIPALQQAADEAEKAAAQARQDAARTAPPASLAAVEQELAAKLETRDKLTAQLQELEEANAIAGRIDAQRLAAHQCDTRTKCAKELLDAVQAWRDGNTRSRVEQIIEPFQRRFETMFGPGSRLDMRSDGTGRGTTFSFALDRGRGIPVDLELLSDGELVMAGAAFLGALQEINGGPGSMLAMATEALSRRGLENFLERAPTLGFDLVLITNNRGEGMSPPGWQVVNMDDPPHE